MGKKFYQKKPFIIGAVIFTLMIIGSINGNNEATIEKEATSKAEKQEVEIDKSQEETEENVIVDLEEEVKEVIPTCDGTNITENCELDGETYSSYKYYPAVTEVYHYETQTTYTTEIVGYCTLCNDGTRSPSCSTGRGTCSHHGGVAEWNAPIYKQVAHTEQVKIIDTPAKEERYEITLQE
ncbi:MAG: hypothetical protein PHD02_03660 [Bacilli bacterium]|nr:hypothetical protein [Bacilli bacterium]